MSIYYSIVLVINTDEPGWISEDDEDPEIAVATPKLDAVNSFLASNYKPPLIRVDPTPGFSETFVAGYNHFPHDEFTDMLKAMTWEYPENVVLVIHKEDERTVVWRPAGQNPKWMRS